MLFFAIPWLLLILALLPLSRAMQLFWGMVICFFIFGGKHYNAWDWVEYEKFYRCAALYPWYEVPQNCAYLSKYEIGFIYLQEFSRLFGSDVHVFYQLISIINIALWVCLIRQSTNMHFLWFFVLWYTNLAWPLWMQVLRQGIATSILIWCLYFANKKAWVSYVLVVLLAMQFHASAIFFLPLAFFLHQPLEKIVTVEKFWKIYLTSMFIAILLDILRIPILQGMAMLPLGSMQQKLLNYVNDPYFNQSASIASYLRGFFYTVVVYHSLKITTNNPMEIMFKRLGILLVVFYPLFSVFFFLARFNFYLMIAMPLLGGLIHKKTHWIYLFGISYFLLLSPLRDTFSSIDFLPFNNYFIQWFKDEILDFEVQRTNLEFLQSIYYPYPDRK